MSLDGLIASTDLAASAIPMTAAQRGIYYAQQLDPTVPMSVAAFAEFRDRVDPGMMARAVRGTVVETESALIRLVEVDDDEPQVALDFDRPIALGIHDFSDADDPRAAARSWIDAHRSKTTDLFTDPLLETHLLTLGPKHHLWYCWGHHLAFDGYAAMYMMLRVAAHYTAETYGTDVPPADTASMVRIAEIDREFRTSERFAEAREHWRSRLTDANGQMPQITSLSNHAAEAAPVATVRAADLDEAVVTAIRAVAGVHGVRPASVITAAVAAYLARFNDSEEAMLSLPVACRDQAVLRTSAGLTSNVVPIRAAIADRDAAPVTVGQLMAATNADIKAALRHQRYRHEDIDAEVLDSRSGRRGFFGPMVNVMLFFEHIDFGTARSELNILSTGPVEDASVNVYDGFTGGMRLDLEANPNVYSDSEIAAHHDRIIDFLARFVAADPDLPVTELALPRSAETEAAEVAATGPAVDHGDNTLVDLLDQAAAEHPGQVALTDAQSGAALTYRELTERAEAIAAGLAGRGVGPESVVAVSLSRSVDQIIALHAVIRAGAAFTPVDPAEPAERREHIITTARPQFVVTDEPTPGEPSVTLAELVSSDTGAPVTRPRTDQPAYVLFTSGSTGKPKGVVITHRAIVNRLVWMQTGYPLGTRDVVLQKTPATFDVSVWEFFWPLMSGASLVVPTVDGHRDPWYLHTVMARHEVTTVHFVPSMLATFADVLGEGRHVDNGASSNTLPALRRIFTSGEALTPSTVAAARRIISAPVHNLYGPTEAAVDVTRHNDCSADELTVPIGRPVDNTSTHVLDHLLAPQPDGAIGELYLGGVQLARGYSARSDLTASRFVASPLGNGERLYRTGDLVRRRTDGELEYLGRTDSQVKIRGQRVELGEIEGALSRLAGVRAAGALLRTDVVADQPVVVGYVSGSADLDSRPLRSELTDALPEHMIPTIVMVLDDLPTTTNGKLDRAGLPAPVSPAQEGVHVEPGDPVDALVAATVAEVLGLDRVSMTAQFFALGGNSLSATRIAARLTRATGHRLGIRSVFDATDLADLAATLRSAGVTVGASQVTTVSSPRPRQDGPVPLSPAQHRLWLTSQLDPAGAAAYNMPFTVRLVGDLDVSALRLALNDVVARHEPLHSRVADIDGTPVIDVVDPSTTHLDLSVIDAGEADSVVEFASGAFDLAADLPIRARLVRTGAGDHQLTIVLHHIAADGWSLAPLATDLAAAYRARRSHTDPDWAPLGTTYSQVSADRHHDQSRDDADLEFWTQTLAAVPAEPELPFDHPRPLAVDASGASVHATVSAARHRDLIGLAESHEATMFMAVHAAVAALLRTLAQTSDIVIGTPVSGRGDADIDAMVGMFVNTLALRTDVDKSASFADLLTQVRETDLTAFDHADLPFDRLVAELNPQRAAGVHPLFGVSVALEDNSAISLEFAGLAATAARIDTGHSKFDLQFTFTENVCTDGSPAGLSVEIAYAAALFERSTVTALARRLNRLIDAVTADADLPIGDIGILDTVERLDLVPALGTGGRPVEHLSRLFADAVAAEPHRVAVSDPTTSLTYRELDVAADRLAARLAAEGAGPETFVAIAMPRSVTWIVAVWAVARTGAAWVPVDPAYPAQRIEFMLTDSRACLLITDAASREILGDATGDLTIVDADAVIAADTEPPEACHPRAPLSVDQPAYLIYTSGTTGTPKGVIVSHRGLADFAASEATQFGVRSDSQTLHMASPSFDASVLEMLMAVSAAATMHIVPPGTYGGRELTELMVSRDITHAFLTPSLLTTMSPEDVPSLQALVIGGEQPNAEVVRRWSASVALYNAYGPTETTVVATVSDEISPDAGAVTIGRPIRGIAAMVLDERLRPVVPGAVGELYIGGPHLARGYHGIRPLTSKRFIANPYGEPGDRMYRTGDLVRWTTDRELEFRGRADYQAKVRGHRIELGEIDAALTADDDVRAAVTVVDGESDRARLVAYVTMTRPETGADVSEIRHRLADRLPRHMVPSAIVVLDTIPTTPIGKVDRKALPAPQDAGVFGGGTCSSLRGPAERSVADLIADRLGLDPAAVGRDDDFFDLGGNSLLATQIAGALEQIGGRRVTVRQVFDHPTVAELAQLAGGADTLRPLPRLSHDPDAVVVPGPAQQQMWFLNRLADTGDDEGTGDHAGYTIAFALDMHGALDVAALRGALRHAVGRHEPLRTVYPEVDGRPVIEVRSADDATGDLAPVDVAAADWHSAAQALAQQPFDLTRQTPIRTALHRIADNASGEHHKLTVVVHHIAADGWSMAPLARDIEGAYTDLRAGRTPSQAPMAVTYRDYLRWQAEGLGADAGTPIDRHDLADDTRLAELTSWWAAELDGLAPGAPLLSDPEANGTGAGVVEVEFGTALRDALVALSDGNATEFMTVHAVLVALLHRLSADADVQTDGAASDIVIGTPVAGRTDPRLADMVGMFVNSVVLRTPVDPGTSFTELLAAVRHSDLEALSQSDMPFEQIVAMLNPPRDGHHPVFRVALAFDASVGDRLTDPGAVDAQVTLDGLDVRVEEVDTAAARFDLEVRLRDDRLRFTYARSMFTPERVATIANQFVRLAGQLAEHPDRPIGELPVTGHLIAPVHTPTSPVHLADLLERTAAADPDATAVDDGTATMTYRDIDEVADSWAARLHSLGLGPDDVVAVALPRSLDSVVAFWAIAKSGAAVLPIDPRYPTERIEHMLSDSGAILGITDSEHLAALPHQIWWVSSESLSTDDDAHQPVIRRPLTLRDPSSTAYVIYTSGSTGLPKGVIVSHRGLAALAQAQREQYDVEPGDRTLHFASPSFDAAMLEFLLAFGCGATMVIAPTDIYGGDELMEFLDEAAVSQAFITPAALQSARYRPLPTLRTLAVGGEASPPELVSRWAPGRRYLNAYGPTETTIVVTMARCNEGDPITIGRPVDGTSALVLDHRLRPLPDGVPGELYLTGPGVARGYLNRTDLTSTRFVASAGIPGETMYRTGDVVHRTVSGDLVYHGRTDNQVKVRGFRIELDEVATALSAHPAVDFATAVVDGDGAQARVIGYVTVDPASQRPATATLIAGVRRTLPRHMVPSAVVVLDEIPLTRNGKLDRAALPSPAVEAATGRGAPAAAAIVPAPVDQPWQSAESVVAAIVADVLGVDAATVGADDDFFLLGGTSLQATTLVSRLNARHTGDRIRVRDVFDHPTLGALADLLQLDAPTPVEPTASSDTGDRTQSGPAPQRRGRHRSAEDDEPVSEDVPSQPTTVPLAPMQRRLWSMANAAPESTEYLMPFALRLSGPLDVGAVRNALVDVVSRHAALRTVYPLGDGSPVGLVLDDPAAVVGDLTPQTCTDATSAVAAFCARPIDPTTQPPLRAHLLATDNSGEQHILLLVLHHIAADGASLPVLVGDLAQAYRERVDGRSDPWAAATLDYRHYAQSATQNAPSAADLDRWVRGLTDAPAESVPPAVAGGATMPSTASAADTVALALEPDLRDTVGNWARAHSTSTFTVLHTALVVLLHRLGAGDRGRDVVIGTPVANRTAPAGDADYNRVVGMFVNTLALRTRLAPGDTVAELLDRVRDADLDGLDRLDVPFDDVVTALNPEREPGRHPLFQVALSVHDYGDRLSGQDIEIADGLTADIAEIDSAAAKFDLQFTVTGMNTSAGEAGQIELTFAADRYRPADANDLLTRFVRVVRAMVCDPDRPVGDIRVTDPLEVADVSPAIGPRRAEPRTFGDLLDDAVRRNPYGIAAVDAVESITYRELSARANRLARVLLGRGVGSVGTEQVIAMAISRSVDAVVAIWAIIRTGAAYVPVDPTYPPDRIAHMLTDSGAALVLTTSADLAHLPPDRPTLALDDPAVHNRLGRSSPKPIAPDERIAPRTDQLAYVIYTSGSTGKPKGVLVPHSGLRAVHDELQTRMRPDSSSRVLHFASPSFDASVLEFLLATSAAATLVIAPTDVYGGVGLARFIADQRVTHAFITPAAVASMAPEQVPTLTGLAIGGEAFGADLARRWAPGRNLINVYGPTETTVIAVGSAPFGPDDELSIGTPNNGVSALVLDDRLHPVPAGVTGELYLLGGQVTRGYHGRRGLTATRFVPAPMVTGEGFAGERMYRTGDLVRWTGDGKLVYVGRSDNQVQLRGFRVELGEIDDALGDEPEVDFAVTIVSDEPGGARLHSYVTPVNGARIVGADLRTRVARRLPRHMVPASVTVLDEVPLTPVGKLDRSALPAPVAGSRSRAPVPGPETRVARVFADVLGVPLASVGADDGFFDLGGNSLLATSLTARLSETFGTEVRAQAVFAAPTTAELAAMLAPARTGSTATVEIDTTGTDAPRMEFAPVLPLRRASADDAAAAPLFAIHPAIGLSWSFTSLLPHLPADQAVYALQNPALSGERPAESIDELAAQYVERVREIVGDGPCRLVGWSLGGLIAQEMAVRLTRAGTPVDQLVLLDSYVVADRPDLSVDPSLGELMAEFGIRPSGAPEPSVDEAFAAVRSVPGPLSGIERSDFDAIHRAFGQASRIADRWHPRRYDGDMVFVTAEADRPAGPPASADWPRYVGGEITEIRVNSTHARMLLPENVPGFVHALRPRPCVRAGHHTDR